MDFMKFACSSFSWHTNDNKHLLGRTYDFFGNLDSNSIAIVPRNYETNLLIDGTNMFKTDFCFTGMSIHGLHSPIFVDGINEHGLMGALLRYPDFATYDTNKGGIDVHPAFLLTYILGKCKNVKELCEEIKNVNLVGEKVFGNEMPVHYIFSDRTGEAVIIEPNKNGITIHRNSIGVLTNSPNYEWHEQNIRNYIHLTPFLTSEHEICNKTFKDFGHPSLDLPSGYTTVSRFVRVALLKNFAPIADNEIDGVTRMFHNFSSVDIPAGVMSRKTKDGKYDYDMTQCMSSMCSESLIYYFNLSNNRRVCAIDLKKEFNNEEIKFVDLPNKQDVLYLN